jgi:predicted homoserine dehydrogenase-like protein
MNLQALLADGRGDTRAADGTVRAGLVGAGQFGASLIAQSRRTPRLRVSAVCDRQPERAVAALRLAGHPEDGWRRCDSAAEATTAVEAGQVAVLEDASVLVGLPIDILVEATGAVEPAAEIARRAIEHGLHVAMVTKEAESVVGPELAARARAAGRVYTPVDGDQPGLLLGLVSWARALGLAVVCAGKSSEYDIVFDPRSGRADWQHGTRTVDVPGLAALWALPDGPPAHALVETLAKRSELLAGIPQRTVPDLCEMLVVVNATDLAPDVPGFHVPVLRAVEVPAAMRPAVDGGLLAGAGAVDVFNCLRRADEASFAGGVFVVVRCEDRESWRMLRDKGHPVTADAGHAMLYNPQHLLGIEAPLSLLQAVLLGNAAGGPPRQRYDLVARAARDWRAGEVLAIDDAHHHEVHGLDPLLLPAAPVTAGNPVPYYMAVEQRLTRDVPAGALITRDMVEPPQDSDLWRLRADLERRAEGPR